MIIVINWLLLDGRGLYFCSNLFFKKKKLNELAMFDYIVFIGLNIFLFSIEVNDGSQVDPKVYCTNSSLFFIFSQLQSFGAVQVFSFFFFCSGN